MARKNSFEDEDSRLLRKSNTHEKRTSSKADRKYSKRQLSDYSCLEDALEEEDYLLDDSDLA